MANRSSRQKQQCGIARGTGRRNTELSETATMAAAETTTTTLVRRPLHIEIEKSQGGLPWRGDDSYKELHTKRMIDSSESPPPPPPPPRIPLTLVTRGSAANNTIRHTTQEEQDDKTEHTVKSVSDLVHKFETKIRNASSSTHDIPKSSTNVTEKAARLQPRPKKYHYYKGSSDETSEISDDYENCNDDDDITALSVSEKAKFFEHLSTRNSSPVHADYYSSNAKLVGVPQFQTKFIHAALRSQLLRSSSAGTLGKIPPLQQHILSLQVLNKSNNVLSTIQSPQGATRIAVDTSPRDSHYIPQPLHLHRQASEITHSTVVVDIHSPLKSQLRKNHYERIFKRTKRQMQHQNATTHADDDISSLTVPSFPEKKDFKRERQATITNKNIKNLESNSSHQRYRDPTKGRTDTNSTPSAEPCDPYSGSPLEHKRENLQRQKSQNYYELIAYAESLRKEMPGDRSKRGLSSTSFSKNSAPRDCQEQEVPLINKYALTLSPIKHASQHSSMLPLVENNLAHSQSDQRSEKIADDCILVAPQAGGGPTLSEGTQKGIIGAQEQICAKHLKKNSLTDITVHQQGEIKQSERHDTSQLQLLSAEESQQRERADDKPPTGEKSSASQLKELEGEQEYTIALDTEKLPNSNYFTPPIHSRKALVAVPTSDLLTDTIDNVHSNIRLPCPESPAPSDEAAANDSNYGDAPSDEKQMPRLSKLITNQRIPDSVSSSFKENIPVPKITVATGRKKKFPHYDEPKKSVEKGSSSRKRGENKVTASLPLASSTNTKRPLRSVPLAPVEPRIRSRVQTFYEKRHEVPRQHVGLPPRNPSSSAIDGFHTPLTRIPNMKKDNSEAVLPSTTQNPKLSVKESRESSDEKRSNTAQDPVQDPPNSSETTLLSNDDAKADTRTDLLSISTKPSERNAKKNYASDGVISDKKRPTGNPNVVQGGLQPCRNGFSETSSKAIINNYRLKPSNEAELETHGERVSKSETKISFGDEDDEICSITMRITRDAKVGPQVGVSISEYGTGSVEVSRLDTPTIQKVANLVLRRNLGKTENERNPLEIDESAIPEKVSQSGINNSEREADPIGNKTLQQDANPSFQKIENGTSAQPTDASEYSESTTHSRRYLNGNKFLDEKRDFESHPWRKPGQIPGKKTIGGISAVSVCSRPSSDSEQSGSLKSVQSSNECDEGITETIFSQDNEKHGAYQGSSTKFSFDDESWTMFSGNEAFTLNTSSSGSTIPPPPPKVPHPSQLGAETSEARIMHGSLPVSDNIGGARPVSRSPQPSASTTTVSDFTLSRLRQTSQSPKSDQSRSASRSPLTIMSIPPPPPKFPHPSLFPDTSDEAINTHRSLPGVESNVLRPGSRSPQPSASSGMSSDFTLRHMRQMSLSPKNTVLRSDLCSPEPSPSRTETFDPFNLDARTGKTSQSPKMTGKRSVSRSSQQYADEIDLFTQQQATRPVSQSPTNSRQRSVSRSSHRKLPSTDNFDPIERRLQARRASQSPTNLKPLSVSVSSQSSASRGEPYERFARDRDTSVSRSPSKFSKNSVEISSRSLSRSPEPSVHQISLDGYKKSSRAVSRSPDSDRSFSTVGDSRIIPQFRGLGSQSSQASFSSSTNDDSFALRRTVSRSPQSVSISSSATSDTFTLRNMRSASSSPTPSIPRLDLSREENDEIRKFLSEPKSSRRSSQLSLSPEKSIQSSAASSHPPCPSPLRLSPTVVSAFENIDLELGGGISKGTVRKVTFDNQVKVRAFVNDSVISPSRENKKQSTQAVKKLSKISKWTSKMCGCLRPPPKRLE